MFNGLLLIVLMLMFALSLLFLVVGVVLATLTKNFANPWFLYGLVYLNITLFSALTDDLLMRMIRGAF